MRFLFCVMMFSNMGSIVVLVRENPKVFMSFLLQRSHSILNSSRPLVLTCWKSTKFKDHTRSGPCCCVMMFSNIDCLFKGNSSVCICCPEKSLCSSSRPLELTCWKQTKFKESIRRVPFFCVMMFSNVDSLFLVRESQQVFCSDVVFV